MHGESDHAERSTRYLADLLEWQTDYEHPQSATEAYKRLRESS